MKKNLNILLVEDEILLALLFQKEIKNIGYIINKTVSSGEKAISEALANPPELILMDIGLPGKIDGIEAAKEIKSKSAIPIIFITGFQDIATRNRAQIEKPLGYFVKPINLVALQTLIDNSFTDE